MARARPSRKYSMVSWRNMVWDWWTEEGLEVFTGLAATHRIYIWCSGTLHLLFYWHKLLTHLGVQIRTFPLGTNSLLTSQSLGKQRGVRYSPMRTVEILPQNPKNLTQIKIFHSSACLVGISGKARLNDGGYTAFGVPSIVLFEYYLHFLPRLFP